MTRMTIRDFLRGGYLRIDEATEVTRRGFVIFTIYPSLGQLHPERLETVEDVVKTVGNGQKRTTRG